MMKKFEVEIEETYVKIIEINAKSENEAYSIAKEKYYNEEIVLESNSFLDYKINVLGEIKNEKEF